MDTGRGVLNTGVYWGEKGRASGRESWGGIAWGEMPDVGEEEEGSKAHCHVCNLCNYLACFAHVSQNLKCNKKFKKKKRRGKRKL